LITVYQLKTRFQNLLRPLVNRLADLGVTPNQVTIAAALLSAITGLLLVLFVDEPRIFLLLPAVLFIRMALNAVDGMLAREHDMKTRRGMYLNELGDVISDAFMYLPLALISGVWGWLVVLVVVFSIITEFTGVLSQAATGTRRYDGPMGKSDRALVFGMLGLLLGLGIEAGNWLNLLFLLVGMLLFITIRNRMAGEENVSN